MNREILFRGKRLDNGEWVEGFYIEDKWGDSSGNELHGILQDRTCPPGLADWTPVPVQKETVGEYTGLTDKNGKKIFEGDIMRLCLGTYPCMVYWDGLGWAWKMDGKRRVIDLSREKMNIIGNIHDNPELLEVEE